ncbi:MAG TPA: rhodanese-like domain-containing protein [Candidatus Dormibacteraeota bacterium]|nr:rhodanese-like domain-containing protein [Candidatus Dormibacteraeota bacterium]
MAGRVFRDEVRRLQAEGAQVVEVLPHAEYEWKHIAGAISLPLTELDERSAGAVLERGRPVVTYCNDFQ